MMIFHKQQCVNVMETHWQSLCGVCRSKLEEQLHTRRSWRHSLAQTWTTNTDSKDWHVYSWNWTSRGFNAACFCAVHSDTKPVIRVVLYIESYASSESWINDLHWCTVCYDWTILKIWNLRVQRNLNIEKIIFKVVQMKFLAMHITNQNKFDILW